MGAGDLIAIGQRAPEFAATTHQQTMIRLSDHAQKEIVVLVFYPGDNTPVCTAQLCGFGDNYAALQSQGAVLYGVNSASAEKHARFAQKQNYPFPLIADEKGRISEAYGCKGFLGLMTKRTVYVIDRNGVVRYAKRGDPPVSEVLGIVQGLQNSKV